MSDTALQLAWMAGFFDGEGCVSLSKAIQTKRRKNTPNVVYTHFQLMVIVTQTSYSEPVEEFHKLFGGTIRCCKNSAGNPTWIWRASGREAKLALIAMRPYFRRKGEDADIAIAVQQLVDDFRAVNPRWNIPIPDDIRSAQDMAYITLRGLHRGVDGVGKGGGRTREARKSVEGLTQ